MPSLATFNLFWFPSSNVPQNVRSDEDLGRVAAVVGHLAADAIVFQEILDPGTLEAMLARVPDRAYRVIHQDPNAHAGDMRVTAAIDERVFDVLETEPVLEAIAERRFHGRRAPLALLLREKASGKQLWFLGVHFKSGLPSTADPPNDEKRAWEAESLARWIVAKRGAAGAPPIPMVVMGDFNLENTRPALSTLTAGELGMSWVAARVSPTTTADPATELTGEEAWSTLLDGVVIDHALVDAGAQQAIAGATIYAFDLDPAFAEPASNGIPFFRVEHGSGYFVIPFAGAGKREVRGMYRVSDHRPLRLALTL